MALFPTPTLVDFHEPVLGTADTIFFFLSQINFENIAMVLSTEDRHAIEVIYKEKNWSAGRQLPSIHRI